jgi:hypothetical protein
MRHRELWILKASIDGDQSAARQQAALNQRTFDVSLYLSFALFSISC